jgi:hypothetical protein
MKSSVKYEVDPAAVLETIHCTQEFRCLKGALPKDCDVSECAGSVCFIKGPSRRSCPYQGHSAYGYFCTCPTRAALFRQHGR